VQKTTTRKQNKNITNKRRAYISSSETVIAENLRTLSVSPVLVLSLSRFPFVTLSDMMHHAWRDVSGWAAAGLALSTGNDEAAKMFDAALTQFIGYYEDRETEGLGGAIQQCLQADSDCIMGHVIGNIYEYLTMACGAFDDPSKAHVGEMSLKAQEGPVTDRERKHVLAVQQLADGQFHKASLLWEEILTTNPTDILALRMAHECCLLLGNRDKLRDIPARVLTAWERLASPSKGAAADSAPPHASAAFALYAFGLAETGAFEAAKTAAKTALQLNANDAMAVQAYGLACFYEGRLEEGIEFVRSRMDNWKTAPALAVRNFWLLGLLMIENGDAGGALNVYDQEILPRILNSMVVVDCNDATNLLFRLCLEGTDVGERWRELYNLGFVHRDEHVHVSTDVHLVVSTLLTSGLAGEDGVTGQAASISESQEMICSQKFYARNGSGDNVTATSDVGVAVSEALLEWVEGNYANAVAKITPIRYELHRLGFSRLHRDVFNIFLICVGLQSPRKEDTAAVRCLLEERKRQMNETPFIEKYHLSIVSGAADAILSR